MTDFILSAFADEASETLEGQLFALKRNDLKQIELRNIDGECVIDLSEEKQRAIKKTLDESNITVSSIASPIGKITLDKDFDEHFSRFKKAVATAKLFETKRIRMFSFFMPQNEDLSEYKAEVLKRLNILCDYANQNDVYCCHENEKEIYGDIAARALEIHESLGDKMKGIFDPANYVQCGEHPEKIFSDLKPYIDYLHIKDANIADGSIVPAGDGDGGIREILREVRQKGACKLLTVEPHLTIFSGFSNLQADTLVHHVAYESSDIAFDTAVNALKVIIKEEGFSYE